MSYESRVLETEGLVSFWPLSEAAGNALDLKELNNGVPKNEAGLTRAQTSLLPSKEGKSCKFIAASLGYFELPDTASLDVGDVFSIEAWIKPESVGTFRSIFGGATNSPLFYVLNTNKMRLDKRGVVAVSEGTTTIEVNTVYHVCVTKNGATRKMYIDGKDVTTNPANQTIEKPVGIYTIGKDAGGTSYFSGYMQNIALYSIAISENVIKQHYNLGQSSSGDPLPFPLSRESAIQQE